MVNLLRRILKRHIDSNHPFWWYAIEAASLCENLAGWCTLPLFMAYHWRELYVVRSLRRTIRTGQTALAFGLPREHLRGMYSPIIAALPPGYDAWLIIPNSAKAEERSMHACWSIFVPWSAYISCWFSLEHPDPIDVRSGKLNIQIYHGVGDAYVSDRRPMKHSKALYRRQLGKFNVHFATGPAIMRTAMSFGPGHTCIEVGYPKTDLLFSDASIPDIVAEDCSFAEDLPLVIYAPHHHEAASLARHGLAAINQILKVNVNLVVKLHGILLADDNPLHKYRAMVEDMARNNPRLRLARESDPGHYYKAADAVVGDTGNSTAFESMLCKKPVVLLQGENREIFTDTDSLEATMARLSTTVTELCDLPVAIANALTTTNETIKRNYDEAVRFLYNPGHATDVAVREIKKAVSGGHDEPQNVRKISFVIPAYNEEKYIGDCLESLTKLSGDPWVHEIIVVVDNASTDSTASIANSFPGVKVLHEEKRGIAAARQKGMEAATGDIYASIDSDCRISPGWLMELKKQFSNNPDLVGLVGEYNYYDMPAGQKFLLSAIAYLTTARLWLLRKEKKFSRGGNSAYLIEKLRQANAFDPKITYFGEDIHTMMAMRKMGNVRYDPALLVDSSARRLNNEGFLKMLFRNKANAVWQHTTGKPLYTHEARHWR